MKKLNFLKVLSFYPFISLLLISCDFFEPTYEIIDNGHENSKNDDWYESPDESEHNNQNEPDFTMETNDIDLTGFFEKEPELAFKSKPNGITRWNEEYRHFVRCESSSGIKTSIALGEDSCGGTLKDNVYSFTPVEEEIPAGKCKTSFVCSTNPNKFIMQETEFQIPNPAEIISPAEAVMLFDIIWSNSDHALFVKNGDLYSVNRDLDSHFLIMENVYTDEGDTFSTANFFYFLSPDEKSGEMAIMKTDGTVENTSVALSREMISDLINVNDRIAGIKYIDKDADLYVKLENINEDKQSLIYFGTETEEVSASKFDTAYNVICSGDKCVFSTLDNYYIFEKDTKQLKEICAGSDKDQLFSFMGNIIISSYANSGCYNSLDINSCEEKEWCECGDYHPNSIDFYNRQSEGCIQIFSNCGNSTVITKFTSDGTKQTSVIPEGDISDIIHSNCENIYRLSSVDFKEPDRKCLTGTEISTGIVTEFDLECSSDNEFKYGGIFNESMMLHRFNSKPAPETYFVSKEGGIITKEISLKYTPSDFSIDIRTVQNNESVILSFSKLTQMFLTDGTAENTSHVVSLYEGESFYSDILGFSKDEILIKTAKYDIYSGNLDNYLNVFDRNTGAKATILSKRCSYNKNGIYPGFYVDRFTFFWVSDNETCESHTLWRTDGTLEGTVTTDIKDTYATFQGLIYYQTEHDDLGGTYLLGVEVFYISSEGEITLLQDVPEDYKYVGKIGNVLYFYNQYSDLVYNLISFKNGEKIKSFEFGQTSRMEQVVVSKSALITLQQSDTGIEPSIMRVYKDGNMLSTPFIQEIYNDEFYDAQILFVNGDLLVLKAVSIHNSATYLKLAKINKDGSVDVSDHFLTVSHDISYDKMIFSGKSLIFFVRGALYTVSFENGTVSIELMREIVTIPGNIIGNTFSGEALFEVTSSYGEKSALITDGKKETSKEISVLYNDSIGIWEGFPFIDRNNFTSLLFIEEYPDGVLSEKVLTEKPIDSYISYSTNKIFYFRHKDYYKNEPVQSFKINF
ncbi:MAG TPA: hypothetical protein PLD55_01690 [bacterium]|nr:hypothetical protein [bacterium]